MRSIERRFSNLQCKRRDHSSLLNFAAAVRAQGFTKDSLSRWFSRLVDKDDYARSDKRAILRDLYALSSGLRGTEKGGESLERDEHNGHRVGKHI